MLLQMEALVVILWIAQPIGKLGMAKTWLSGLHRTHYAIQIQPKTTSAKALWWIQVKAQNNSRGRMLLQFISVNSGCQSIQSPCALYAWPLNGFPFFCLKTNGFPVLFRKLLSCPSGHAFTMRELHNGTIPHYPKDKGLQPWSLWQLNSTLNSPSVQEVQAHYLV